MPQEIVGYRDLQERLAGFRTEILGRMRRDDELAVLPGRPWQNLAAFDGALVTVDSFLGTLNTDRPRDVYFPVRDARMGDVQTGAVPFAVEDPEHPVLAELRHRFDLEAIAGDGPDVSRAVRLRDWLKSLFPHNIPYRMPPWNALLILDRATRGVDNFICMHYSVSLVQCCLAVGMQARMINLHRGIAENYRIGDEAIADPPVDEHVVAEVWSSELGSWVMMDTDFDCHYERDGMALSAWQVHEAFTKGELDQIRCRRGPHSKSFTALADDIADDNGFFSRELPSYFAHVSVIMRNDFLSDPDGPVTVAHLVDSFTEPILWHGGSDLRLQPHLMGPVVVATPYTSRVRILTDGNDLTAWASADTPDTHQVDIALREAATVGRIGLVWPEYRGLYRTSRHIVIEAQRADRWEVLAESSDQAEAPFTLYEFPAVETTRIRVRQPAGGGHLAHRDRLWLAQIDVLTPAGGSAA